MGQTASMLANGLAAVQKIEHDDDAQYGPDDVLLLL